MAVSEDQNKDQTTALLKQWGMMFGLLKDGVERSDLVHKILIAVLVVFSLLPVLNLAVIMNK
jgi:hypothetical protein